MNLSIDKNSMKLKSGESYQPFYFQVRESPTPLNIPIPTPASDQGGPVACIGGPAACIDAQKKRYSFEFGW